MIDQTPSRIQSPLDLPPEILHTVVSYLEKADFQVCALVNSVWYSRFIDDVWSKVYLKKSALAAFSTEASPSEQEAVSTAKDTPFQARAVQCSTLLSSTPNPLARNLHRVQTLTVAYLCTLATLLPNVPLGAPAEALRLEELVVFFLEDFRRAPVLLPPLDIQPLIRALDMSQNLKRLTINLSPLSLRNNPPADQVLLFTALPRSLEHLTLSMSLPGLTIAMRDVKSHIPEVLSAANTKSTGGIILNNLKALRINGWDLDFELFRRCVLDRCAALEELETRDFYGRLNSTTISQLIASSGATGWKTLGFDTQSGVPLTHPVVQALLQPNVTSRLENLRLDRCRGFDSKAIRTLFCSAPRLRRFDTIGRQYASGFHRVIFDMAFKSTDIIESSKDWVCLGLETFKCRINDIPRPDLQERVDGRPLIGDCYDPEKHSIQDSRQIQRRVLFALGRLTKLREITLGPDNVANREHDRVTAHQYDCLTMTLVDGLDELRGLKSLQRLHMKNMSQGQGAKECEWMKANWPMYGKESKDAFWTKRGHIVVIGADIGHQRLGDDDRHGYDWW